MINVVVHHDTYALYLSPISGPFVVAGDSRGLTAGGLPRLRGVGLFALSGFDPPSPGVVGVPF